MYPNTTSRAHHGGPHSKLMRDVYFQTIKRYCHLGQEKDYFNTEIDYSQDINFVLGKEVNEDQSPPPYPAVEYLYGEYKEEEGVDQDYDPPEPPAIYIY